MSSLSRSGHAVSKPYQTPPKQPILGSFAERKQTPQVVEKTRNRKRYWREFGVLLGRGSPVRAATGHHFSLGHKELQLSEARLSAFRHNLGRYLVGKPVCLVKPAYLPNTYQNSVSNTPQMGCLRSISRKEVLILKEFWYARVDSNHRPFARNAKGHRLRGRVGMAQSLRHAVL